MDAQRLFAKIYVREPSTITPHDLVPVFHKWIQTRALDEVLIDVADYGHVHNGPGVLLIGHAANYGIDLSDGRIGLIYGRKRAVSGTWEERLRSCFRSLLTACRRLEEEPALAGRARFSGREFLFRINDRLLAPNAPETFAAVEPELRTLFSRLFGGAPFELTPSADPQELFAVRVRAAGEAPTVASLLERL